MNHALPNTSRERSWKSLLFLVVVVGSTLVALVYYYLIAADQYVTEFRFNLRSASNPFPAANASGAGGGMAMAGINPTVLWDSYAIVQFIQSREMADILQEKINLRGIYASKNADFINRLNPKLPDERVAQYWRHIVDPFFDMNTGVISVKVRAFSPEESLKVAQTVLAESEAQVNALTERSRADSLKYFTNEVELATAALKETDEHIRMMRNQHGILDPERKSALSDSVQSRQLEMLTNLRTRYASTLASVGKHSPLLPAMRSQIAALEAQINSQQSTIAQPHSKNETKLMSGILDQYDDLLRDQTMRLNALTLTQEALQRARIDLERQQLYLNAFVRPIEATSSTYPKRGQSVLIVFSFALLAWLLLSLAIHAVQDHL